MTDQEVQDMMDKIRQSVLSKYSKEKVKVDK